MKAINLIKNKKSTARHITTSASESDVRVTIVTPASSVAGTGPPTGPGYCTPHPQSAALPVSYTSFHSRASSPTTDAPPPTIDAELAHLPPSLGSALKPDGVLPMDSPARVVLSLVVVLFCWNLWSFETELLDYTLQDTNDLRLFQDFEIQPEFEVAGPAPTPNISLGFRQQARPPEVVTYQIALLVVPH